MKELPLLSSDFEPFLWSQSNGEASLEQTKESFNALYNKDMCYKFSYLVWNDLVDKLNDALTQAGLTWKTTYGTVSSTKLTDKLTDFTARRFNSVAYNIDHLINNSWKWAVVPDINGFLGRARVKGYRDVGVSADIVYGWYLIELARVVNLFIDILKNEADFSELVYGDSIETSVNDGITNADGYGVEYGDSIETSVDGVIRSGDKLITDIDAISESVVDSEVVQGAASLVDADNISETLASTELNNGESVLASSVLKSLTNASATIKAYAVGLMKATGSQRTLLDSEFTGGDAIRVEHDDIGESILDSEMNTGDADRTEAEGIGASSISAEMITIIPSYLESDAISETNTSFEMISITPYLVIGKEISESNVSSDVRMHDGLLVDVDNIGKSTHASNIIGSVGELIKSALISTFNVFAKLSFDSGAISDWVEQVGSNLYIRQAYKFINEENNGYFDRTVDVTFWVDPIKEGSDLYIRMDFHEEGD